jgi:inosose dehydratase
VPNRARRTAAIHAELGLTGMFIACGMSKKAVRVAHRRACGYAFDQTRVDRVVESLSEVAEAMCAEGVRPGLVNHVHVKDVSGLAVAKGQADGLNYAQTVLAGAWMETGFGDIDLEAVLDVLGQEFEGWPVAEVDRPNLPTADESIAACARWFQGEHRSEQ